MSLLICDTSLIAVEAGSNAGVVFPRPTLLLLCALSRGAMKDWIGPSFHGSVGFLVASSIRDYVQYTEQTPLSVIYGGARCSAMAPNIL